MDFSQQDFSGPDTEGQNRPSLVPVPDSIVTDARRWFPGRHASGEFGILSPADGHEVARCQREIDRDFILLAARAHAATHAALEHARATLEALICTDCTGSLSVEATIARCDAALAPLSNSRTAGVSSDPAIPPSQDALGSAVRDAPSAAAEAAS